MSSNRRFVLKCVRNLEPLPPSASPFTRFQRHLVIMSQSLIDYFAMLVYVKKLGSPPFMALILRFALAGWHLDWIKLMDIG